MALWLHGLPPRLCFCVQRRISLSTLLTGSLGRERPLGVASRDFQSLSTSIRSFTVKNESVSAREISDSGSVDTLGSSAELSVNSPIVASADALDVDSIIHLKMLFEARVHLGHKHGCWNPIIKPYIYGTRHNVHIFDLDTTLTHLKLALKVAGLVAYRNGVILFVNERSQFDRLVQQTARESGQYFFSPSWYPGIFTNSFMLLKTMKLPDLVIFLSVHASEAAVKEVAMCNIPSVGIVDSNCDPNLITYPIPGNDDSPTSVQLYCKLFGEVIRKAKQLKKKENAVEDQTTKTASLL